MATTQSPDRVFRFKYTVFTVEARLDEARLEVRAGVRTSVAPVTRMQHVFVHRDRAQQTAELVVSYVASRGRLRRLRVFADAHEPAFDALVEALLARRPELDIRHLERGDAYRRMGSQTRDAVVLPALMAVAIAIMGAMFAPMVVHGFDDGEAQVTVAELAAGQRPETRNLVVEGRAAVDQMIVAIPEVDPPPSTVTGWIPLVEPGWAGEPVAVVLEVRGRPVEAVTALGEQQTFRGVLRDVLWEGLEQRRRLAFEARGVRLAPEVALIEHGASSRDDLALSAGVLGLLGVMLVAVIVVTRRQRRTVEARPTLNRPRGFDADEGEWD